MVIDGKNEQTINIFDVVIVFHIVNYNCLMCHMTCQTSHDPPKYTLDRL